MCGFYHHTHYWQENEEYKVLLDFKINKHDKSKEARGIPAKAVPCGIDPVNGKPANNANGPIPVAVEEKLHFAFEVYYPDIDSIIDFMRLNYGKHGDKDEWQKRLPLMLSSKGVGIFLGKQGCADLSKSYADLSKSYADLSKSRADWSKSCADRSKSYADRSKSCADLSKSYADLSKSYADLSKYYADRSKSRADWSKYYAIAIESAPKQGCLDPDNWLESFVAVFRKYPNEFWAGRKSTSCIGFLFEPHIFEAERKEFAVI